MPALTDHRVAEALFTSDLQPSQHPDLPTLNVAAVQVLARFGCEGCTARVAAEFGDHPDTAAARMRWALECEAALCCHTVVPA